MLLPEKIKKRMATGYEANYKQLDTSLAKVMRNSWGITQELRSCQLRGCHKTSLRPPATNPRSLEVMEAPFVLRIVFLFILISWQLLVFTFWNYTQYFFHFHLHFYLYLPIVIVIFFFTFRLYSLLLTFIFTFTSISVFIALHHFIFPLLYLDPVYSLRNFWIDF